MASVEVDGKFLSSGGEDIFSPFPSKPDFNVDLENVSDMEISEEICVGVGKVKPSDIGYVYCGGLIGARNKF